ncbi:MAG TPA: SHOCT domain-containing protein [Acidimicrobiales bacterium]|nr:SHOCT domain-containing protein [Acidimicrobiales bacterium]
MFFAEFGTGQVFLSMLYFTLFVIWVWLLFAVFADIFRSHELSGWAKAAWSVFVIVFPYLGVFVYLIARGGKMSEHAIEDARRRDEAFRQYVQEAATSPTSEVDQLAKLATLRADGVITDEEFQHMKAKIAA